MDHCTDASDLLCQVCLDYAHNPVVWSTWYDSQNYIKLFCEDCYWKCSILAKNLKWEYCFTLNPIVYRTGEWDNNKMNSHHQVGKILATLLEDLNTLELTCPNLWDNATDCDYDTLIEHFKAKECDGDPGFTTSGIKEIQLKIEEMKDNKSYFMPEQDTIKLEKDWGEYHAKWLICQYLSNLDGYICYNWTRLCCKDHCEEFTHHNSPRIDENYHPFGFMLCVYCKKYAMVRLDRITSTYDQIFKFKIPNCSEPKCKTTDLYYFQMYQHELVCTGDLDKSLDPLKLDLIPYFHKEGDKVSLLDSDIFKRFYNSPVPVTKTVKTNITLGKGFRVCLLRHTNHVFIVGGEGTETKTHLFNSQTNMIEETKWDLVYPRQYHSLCSDNNTIIATGSKIEEGGNKVEVFK